MPTATAVPTMAAMRIREPMAMPQALNRDGVEVIQFTSPLSPAEWENLEGRAAVGGIRRTAPLTYVLFKKR